MAAGDYLLKGDLDLADGDFAGLAPAASMAGSFGEAMSYGFGPANSLGVPPILMEEPRVPAGGLPGETEIGDTFLEFPGHIPGASMAGSFGSLPQVTPRPYTMSIAPRPLHRARITSFASRATTVLTAAHASPRPACHPDALLR